MPPRASTAASASAPSPHLEAAESEGEVRNAAGDARARARGLDGRAGGDEVTGVAVVLLRRGGGGGGGQGVWVGWYWRRNPFRRIGSQLTECRAFGCAPRAASTRTHLDARRDREDVRVEDDVLRGTGGCGWGEMVGCGSMRKGLRHDTRSTDIAFSSPHHSAIAPRAAWASCHAAEPLRRQGLSTREAARTLTAAHRSAASSRHRHAHVPQRTVPLRALLTHLRG